MIRCTKCNRPLKRATASGMGPVCERAVLGPRRRPLFDPKPKPRDERQQDMFEREQDVATTVHSLIGGVSLEMTR